MRFDWWTFALQTVNFVVLVWLLHRFLYQPVLRVMDSRRAEVQKQYSDAAALQAQAKAALVEIEAQRAGIAAERAAALKAAATQAEESAAASRAHAEREAASILESARKTNAAEREAALTEARHAALDLGAEIARRLLDDVPLQLRAQAWLERIEQHLASMTSAGREGLVEELNGGGTLRVVTAVPLSDSVMNDWRDRLGRALGDRTRIEFADDAMLIAGVELHFPGTILRFSWSSALATIRAEIESHDDTR